MICIFGEEVFEIINFVGGVDIYFNVMVGGLVGLMIIVIN